MQTYGEGGGNQIQNYLWGGRKGRANANLLKKKGESKCKTMAGEREEQMQTYGGGGREQMQAHVKFNDRDIFTA